MALYAIGDIHGNYALLRGMISAIRNRIKEEDKIVFLGDIIDGGNDSKRCIDLIINLKNDFGSNVICVMGNHEEWFLETKTNFNRHSWIISMEGLKTIESYSKKAAITIKSVMQKTGLRLIEEKLSLPYDIFFNEVPDTHMKLISSMTNYYEDENCICVHAGVSVTEHDMTKMDNKKMRWGYEGFPEKYTGKKTVIYGHWSKKAKIEAGRVMPFVKANTVCLDTHRFGVLTSLKIPGNIIIQVATSSK